MMAIWLVLNRICPAPENKAIHIGLPLWEMLAASQRRNMRSLG